MATGPLQRSDARRNRARLTEVAAAAFRDEGLDVGVDAIARRAGVGIATLYRHFPAKSDLILAVVESVLDDFEASVAATLGASAPEDVVARLLEQAVDQPSHDRALLEALALHDLPAGMRDGLSRRVLGILEPVVAAGRRAGTLDPAADAADLLVAIKMLGVVCGGPAPCSADRYVAMILRGLAPAHSRAAASAS